MGKGRGGGPCASTGYTPIFWGLCAAAGVAFVLVIVGHALAGAGEDVSEPGELPVWYQIDACQKGKITTDGAGDVTLCAKEVSSCPTSWNMHVARKAPKDVTGTGTACPAVVEEQEEVRIALEPDDGFVEGPPYSPVFVLPTGASALISFKIEYGEGGTLLPTTNAELGPGTTYPWRELSRGFGAVLLPPGAPPPSSPSTPPPTPPTPPGRRLAATEADPHAPASLIQQEALRGVQVEDAAQAPAERDEGTVPAPGSRRLLKGGSSGGGGFGSSGSSSGSSSSRGFSTSGRTNAYSSGYSRSSSITSYSTSSYSSYRPGGYYSSSGGSYYGGGRPYGYRYGYGGYRTSTSIYIVRPYFYGCYSCGRRTCNSCGSCNTRRECNGEEPYTTAAPLDRYEFLDSKFTMQKARWPAFLVIHNATIFTSTPGATSAYVTFFRDGGEPGKEGADAGGVILALAYLAFACILIACCCFLDKGKIRIRPAGGYPQAGWMTPAAQPMVQAYPQAAPMVQAYPQAAQPMVQAYPQAAPMVQAYPSAPASPPDSPDSPSEPVVEKKDE